MSRKPDLTFDCLVHDLNNVFQIIIDAAELVGADPNWASVSAIILRSVEQGRRVVASIAEKDYGSVPVELLAENAIAFSEDCVTAMKGPVLEFERDIAPGIHTSLGASALERVLVNLFINASQAAKSAGNERCRIRVSAKSVDGKAAIVVADDGPGIPDDVLPVIFTPRFSTDQNRSGLGLHIVHSLVTGAGGAVGASNFNGGGAVFRIEVPLAQTVAIAVP